MAILPIKDREALLGLDRLLASLSSDGLRAPILDTLGFEAVEFAFGRAIFAITPAHAHYNNVGSMHGGVVATLLDSAASCAVYSALSPGLTSSTSSLTVGFVRPITELSGPLRCEGELLKLGRRIGHASARLADAAGRLFAHASAICAISALGADNPGSRHQDP